MLKHVNISVSAFVVGLGLALTLSACNKAPVAASTPSAVVSGTAAATPVGQKARCPVTGEEFVVAANTVQVEHDGKHYAFCCADCQPSFDKDPAKYTKKN